jgi:hypothetical protein
MITMNVLDKDIIKNKVLTPKELKDYSELRIGSKDGHEKWLFLHDIQSRITKAVETGVVTKVAPVECTINQAPAIRGAN